LTCYIIHLQLISWTLHEEKIHDVVYDDIWSKQLGNDKNVYHNPLVEDLKLLWVDGVEVFDVVASETFMIHAMLFCTINDFPTYGNLSGYSVKGHKTCPICEENTASH